MKTTPRPISGPADLGAMIALACQHPQDHLRVTDLPYRLSSWALDEPQNTALWEDESGHLLAWAVLQTPFWTIDITCAPQAEAALFPHILAWADARARQAQGTPYALPCWFINIFSDQPGRSGCLEAAGFADQSDVGEDSWSKVFMRRPGDLPVADYRIPAGFTIRPLAGQAEVPAYVDLHRAVFESKNMTVEWRSRTLQHPDYLPDLDIVVEAPDGHLGAYCIGWLNRRLGAQPVGQIEPLGCHADFRRYALGRLALAETLRRLRAYGVSHIHVETDNYRNTAHSLYQAMGFAVIRSVLIFRKDYPTPD